MANCQILQVGFSWLSVAVLEMLYPQERRAKDVSTLTKYRNIHSIVISTDNSEGDKALTLLTFKKNYSKKKKHNTMYP